jgi:hypothetical protein
VQLQLLPPSSPSPADSVLWLILTVILIFVALQLAEDKRNAKVGKATW